MKEREKKIQKIQKKVSLRTVLCYTRSEGKEKKK
jgi:hypothetical protein